MLPYGTAQHRAACTLHLAVLAAVRCRIAHLADAQLPGLLACTLPRCQSPWRPMLKVGANVRVPKADEQHPAVALVHTPYPTPIRVLPGAG